MNVRNSSPLFHDHFHIIYLFDSYCSSFSSLSKKDIYLFHLIFLLFHQLFSRELVVCPDFMILPRSFNSLIITTIKLNFSWRIIYFFNIHFISLTNTNISESNLKLIQIPSWIGLHIIFSKNEDELFCLCSHLSIHFEESSKLALTSLLWSGSIWYLFKTSRAWWIVLRALWSFLLFACCKSLYAWDVPFSFWDSVISLYEVP